MSGSHAAQHNDTRFQPKQTATARANQSQLMAHVKAASEEKCAVAGVTSVGGPKIHRMTHGDPGARRKAANKRFSTTSRKKLRAGGPLTVPHCHFAACS